MPRGYVLKAFLKPINTHVLTTIHGNNLTGTRTNTKTHRHTNIKKKQN